MNISELGQKFFHLLMNALESEGACPILLRNYEGLPEEIGNDIDIFVKRSGMRRLMRCVKCCADSIGGSVLNYCRRGYVASFWISFPDQLETLHVDLYDKGLSWHGISYLDGDRFISMSQSWKQWRIPDPSHEAFVSVCTSILWGGFFKERYLHKSYEVLGNRDHLIEFRRNAVASFGKCGEQLTSEIMERTILETSSQRLAREMRRSLIMRSFFNSPLATTIGWAGHWISECRCHLAPPGILVTYNDLSVANEEIDIMIQSISESAGGCFTGIIELPRSGGSISRTKMLWRRIRCLAKGYIVLEAGTGWRFGTSLISPGSDVTGYKWVSKSILDFAKLRSDRKLGSLR